MILSFISIEIGLADTSVKKNVYVCQLALNDTDDGWNNEWVNYVNEAKSRGFSPVSYTHLTLPTKRIV